jgi:hypothetical protein
MISRTTKRTRKSLKPIVMIVENKFKEGEVVFERTRPAQKLIVRNYRDNIYYCKSQENTTRKHLVYFERELLLVGSALGASR